MHPWYKDGLHFECTQCGRCCGGSPGVVWVDRHEILRIAQFLQVDAEELWGSFIRRVGIGRVSLVEQANGDCAFLRRDDTGSAAMPHCGIYAIRPQQCRTWPFWNQNLGSRGSWQTAGRQCPGIDRGPGRLYELPQIESIRLAPPWHQLPEDQRRAASR